MHPRCMTAALHAVCLHSGVTCAFYNQTSALMAAGQADVALEKVLSDCSCRADQRESNSRTLTLNVRSSQMQALNHMRTGREQSRTLNPCDAGAGARASADSEFRAPRTRPRQGTKRSILQTHPATGARACAEPTSARAQAGGRTLKSSIKSNARPHVAHRHLAARRRPLDRVQCKQQQTRAHSPQAWAGPSRSGRARMGSCSAHITNQASLHAPHAPTSSPPTGSSRAQ